MNACSDIYQAMPRSRRPSLNVNIPSERSAKRKSPSLCVSHISTIIGVASFLTIIIQAATPVSEDNIFLRSPFSRARSRSLGSPNPPNPPNLQIPRADVPQIQVTNESDQLAKPDEYHSTKRALPESPVMAGNESRLTKARRIE